MDGSPGVIWKLNRAIAIWQLCIAAIGDVIQSVRISVSDIGCQSAVVNVLVLDRNAAIVRDRIVAENSNLARIVDPATLPEAPPSKALKIWTKVLIQVIVRDEQVVTMIPGIGNDHRIILRDLPLQLHAEFKIPSTVKVVRSRGVVGREERYPLRASWLVSWLKLAPCPKPCQHSLRGSLCKSKGASRILGDCAGLRTQCNCSGTTGKSALQSRQESCRRTARSRRGQPSFHHHGDPD